jgi:hypothetical protein
MKSPFDSAYLKIERAEEHINDLSSKGQAFADTHPHHLRVKTHLASGDDALCISPAEQFPDSFLLILGDAIHNLRSALDHAWVQSVINPHKDTKFPVRKTRNDFEAAINGLKENAREEVKRFLVEIVQAYEGGMGEIILGLHDLDIEDKHRLLIAYRQFHLIRGIRAIDERDVEFSVGDWLVVNPHMACQRFEGHPHFKIANKGQAVTRITFGEGSVLQGRYLMPTLKALTNIVEQIVIGLENIVMNEHREHPVAKDSTSG